MRCFDNCKPITSDWNRACSVSRIPYPRTNHPRQPQKSSPQQTKLSRRASIHVRYNAPTSKLVLTITSCATSDQPCSHPTASSGVSITRRDAEEHNPGTCRDASRDQGHTFLHQHREQQTFTDRSTTRLCQVHKQDLTAVFSTCGTNNSYHRRLESRLETDNKWQHTRTHDDKWRCCRSRRIYRGEELG